MSEIEVKALEWTRVPKEAWDDPETRRATTPVHRQYYITFEQGDWWYANKPYKTEDEAKAAAQSDFDARIRSAIERKAEPVAWQWCAYEDGSQRTSWYPEGDSYQADWEELAKKYPDKYQVVTRPLYSTPPAAAVTGEGEPVAWLRHGEEVSVQNVPFGAMWISDKDDPRAFPVYAAPSPVGDRDALIERLVRALEPFATVEPMHVFSAEDDDDNGDYVLTENQFRFARAAHAAAKEQVTVSLDEAWDELCNYDDRTSPEGYPDMCLITRDELAEFMRKAVRGDSDD